MYNQITGTDSEHSKPPRGLGALLLRYLPESVEKELALTCMDSEARINYPFHIASPRVLPKATGSRCGWSDGGGPLPHTKNNTLIMRTACKWNGQPWEGPVPPEEWWWQHSWALTKRSAQGGRVASKIYVTSPSLGGNGPERFLHPGRGGCLCSRTPG